jgi:AraC family transcriptional regulator
MSNNPKTIGNWNGLILMQQTGRSSHGPHHHASHMLRLQTQGVTINEWRSEAGSGTTIIEPGSLSVISAKTRHDKCSDKHDDSQEEPQQMIALLTEAMLQEAAGAASVRTCKIQLAENRKFRDVQLERLLWALHGESLGISPVSHLVGDMLSNAIATHLVGNYTVSQDVMLPYRGGIPRRQLTHVLDYIEAHLHQNLPLTALAEAAAMSPFHFSRAFRQSMGLSPHQYVLVQRIERAKLVLRSHELTVGEVSVSVGFIRQNHFTRVFQKRTGLTPTEFRRRI